MSAKHLLAHLNKLSQTGKRDLLVCSPTNNAVLHLVIGAGYEAYDNAKRWVVLHFPNLTPAEYAQFCCLVAKITGV